MDCPFCGERISAGAVKCPNCSEYIGETLSYDEEMKLRARDKTTEDHAMAKKPVHALHKIKHFSKHSTSCWIWNIGAVLVLAAVIIALYFLNKQA